MPLAARQIEAELAQEGGSALADHPLAVRSLGPVPRRLGTVTRPRVSNSFGRVITWIEEFVGTVAAGHVKSGSSSRDGARTSVCPTCNCLSRWESFGLCLKKELAI